jgi:hypothetical protein
MTSLIIPKKATVNPFVGLYSSSSTSTASLRLLYLTVSGPGHGINIACT